MAYRGTARTLQFKTLPLLRASRTERNATVAQVRPQDSLLPVTVIAEKYGETSQHSDANCWRTGVCIRDYENTASVIQGMFHDTDTHMLIVSALPSYPVSSNELHDRTKAIHHNLCPYVHLSSKSTASLHVYCLNGRHKIYTEPISTYERVCGMAVC
jgi:hypothetical protein